MEYLNVDPNAGRSEGGIAQYFILLSYAAPACVDHGIRTGCSDPSPEKERAYRAQVCRIRRIFRRPSRRFATDSRDGSRPGGPAATAAATDCRENQVLPQLPGQPILAYSAKYDPTGFNPR
ncbi:hypothetical protein [Burkholderia latens]|uniref:hypothetical protein n=1 Tax=Burkholderia latens TaxID=488446 RepID=UPI0039A5C729